MCAFGKAERYAWSAGRDVTNATVIVREDARRCKVRCSKACGLPGSRSVS